MYSANASNLAGAALGLVVDGLLGEPPDRVHPVAALGRVLGRVEQHSYRDSKAAGAGHVVLAAAAAGAAGYGVERIVGRAVGTAALVSTAVAGNMLGDVAMEVARHLEDEDLPGARRALRSLVGRDPSSLDEQEIVRAVVESVAENTVDAVTASLVWAALFGSVGVAVHRTVNTLDAMVGHRNDRYRRFGWASARLDDAMNFGPARLTALMVAAVGPSNPGAVLRVVGRDGRNHPSPNGGMVEAAFAGALGITLGGTNDYGGVIEQRGPLGDGPAPDRADIAAAVELSKRSAWATLVALVAARGAIHIAATPWRHR